MCAFLIIEGPLEMPGILVASADPLWSGLSLPITKLTLGYRLSRLATRNSPLDVLNSTSPFVCFRTFPKSFDLLACGSGLGPPRPPSGAVRPSLVSY
jgi:hypothetical protein